jgi:hypothetical protein
VEEFPRNFGRTLLLKAGIPAFFTPAGYGTWPAGRKHSENLTVVAWMSFLRLICYCKA